MIGYQERDKEEKDLKKKAGNTEVGKVIQEKKKKKKTSSISVAKHPHVTITPFFFFFF